MPNPTPGSVHVDQLLTNVSVAFVQSSTKFVADQVFPRVPVDKQSGKIATYSKQDFLRDEVDKRAPGDAAVSLGYRPSSTSYVADEWAAEHPIDDQVRSNADSPFMPERDATQFLTQKMLIKRERQFATNFLSSGSSLWTGSSDGADLVGGTDFTQWSNAAATPIEDIHSKAENVEIQTGFLPNKLVINRTVWHDLKNHPDIVDRVKHTSDGPVTQDIVARLCGLDNIHVASAVHYNAGEGLSTNAGAYIASDLALLVYATNTPSLMQPSGGYTLTWDGLIPGANMGQAVETYRDESRVSDVVRVRSAWAQKRVAPSVGVLFTNVSTRA